MIYCDKCGHEAQYHIYIQVDTLDALSNRNKRKALRMALCKACERKLSGSLARDRWQRGRLAVALVNAKSEAIERAMARREGNGTV